jgi:hypothetical protein
MCIAVAALAAVVVALAASPYLRHKARLSRMGLAKNYTIGDRVKQYGEAAAARWRPHFTKSRVSYPPDRVALLGLKQEKTLQVYAAGNDGALCFVRSYPIHAASGSLGPKLKEGDRQVPEGIYRVESLNPNSAFHLSLRLNYPNKFDREMAQADGRTKLGGDIMIHGGSASIGCLAMGDEAAEDLFVLAATVGTDNMRVILSPVDLRTRELPQDAPPRPAWVDKLYAEIRAELLKIPASEAMNEDNAH